MAYSKFDWNEYNAKNPTLGVRVSPGLRLQINELKKELGAKSHAELLKILIEIREDQKMNSQQQAAKAKLIKLAEAGDVTAQAACEHKSWNYQAQGIEKSLLPHYKRLRQEVAIIQKRYPGMSAQEILALFDKQTTEAA